MDTHSPMFKLIFGIIGNIIGVAVNLAPMPTFWRIYKKKCTEGFSGLPYVFSLISALLWVLYALPMITKNALLLIPINAISSSIQIFYLTVFFIYADRKPGIYVMKVMAACFFFLGLVAVLTIKVVKENQRTRTVGSLVVVIGIITYASPLSVTRMVILTRSVEFLPILLCIFLFINSIVWTCYGFIAHDVFVMTPNGLGVLLGTAQIALYLTYRNAKALEYPKKGEPADPSVRPSPLNTFAKTSMYTPNGQSVDSDGNLNGLSLPSQNGVHGNHHVAVDCEPPKSPIVHH